MTKTPQDVLEFWFSDQMKPNWFAKSDEIDARIRDDFATTYQAAHDGRLEHWMQDVDSALALVIVLDQFPRNIYRGDARSFESNSTSVTCATRPARSIAASTPELPPPITATRLPLNSGPSQCGQ